MLGLFNDLYNYITITRLFNDLSVDYLTIYAITAFTNYYGVFLETHQNEVPRWIINNEKVATKPFVATFHAFSKKNSTVEIVSNLPCRCGGAERSSANGESRSLRQQTSHHSINTQPSRSMILYTACVYYNIFCLFMKIS